MSEADNAALASLAGLLRSHMRDFQNQSALILEMDKKITLLLQAFPEEGGPIGHRVYHENMQRECEDRRVVRTGVKTGVTLHWTNMVILIIVIGVVEFVIHRLGVLI